MSYATFDVPTPHTGGGAPTEVTFYQQPTTSALTIEVLSLDEGVESMLPPDPCRLTVVKVSQSMTAKAAWQPRTERGRMLMALRERVVASGVRLLDLDEINQGLAGGRRQGV